MEFFRKDISYHMWNLEGQFIYFYYEMIIDELQWTDLQSNDNFMRKIRDGYSNYVLKNKFSNMSFDSHGMRCAYIFSKAPHFASCVAHHFLKFLHENEWFLLRTMSEKSLKLCCLGGGPGTEVVAVAKVLELISQLHYFPNMPIIIHATIIDIDPGWRITSKKMTQNWWKRINHKVIKLKISFEQADLTQPLSAKVQEILRNSNFVTMVHFVSAVYGTKEREKISEMLQGVIQNMSEDGVLFFLNGSRYTNLKVLGDVVISSANMSLVYGPCYFESHNTTNAGRRLSYRLYSSFYGISWRPLFESRNHIAAWRKLAVTGDNE